VRIDPRTPLLLLMSALPMLGALGGGWLDQRHHLGFTIWRAACRSTGLRFASLVDFTVQLLPTALAGVLLGGLAVLVWGLMTRERHAGLCLAAHAGCALTLPLALLLCASALPLPVMLLADKIWLLEELRSRGHRAFVIGDGINDGPVLAAAEVSCALGAGSAIAQSAADLLLVNEDLTVLSRAVSVARATMRVVRQNLAWSLVYNFSAVPAAALGWIPPWLAALGMSLSSLAVALNARRLARSAP
jgi:hypothetical protein